MTVSAHDVAREIRQQLPRVGILKLQKLLYYCQGWYIAWTDAPLFGEQIEAWANGPVVADSGMTRTRTGVRLRLLSWTPVAQRSSPTYSPAMAGCQVRNSAS